MWGLIAWLGSIAVILIVTWLVRRSQRGVDDYFEREYRDPPVFQWPDGGVP